MRNRQRSRSLHASLLALAALPTVSCTTSDPSTRSAEQAVINPPLPSNLNLALNARDSVTVGPFAQVFGDVASSGLAGSVLFDVGATQGPFFSNFNLLASTVLARTSASVGRVIGNDVTIEGTATSNLLGLDPSKLPQIPNPTVGTPGTVNVSTNQNQARQLCPGQYGAIALGANSTLNLNGGVYQVTRLSLAEGARLEPSEPVVILVSGDVVAATGAIIQPSAQSVNPMRAADIRIEATGAISLGDSSQARAHLLASGPLTIGRSAGLTGAAWATTIRIGPQSVVNTDGVFSAQAPTPPPPCNDNNACTVDSCVGSGTAVAFCRNEIKPVGTSCDDGNVCNGTARCDAGGTCQPGSTPPSGTSCGDGNACNGDETCDGFGSCLQGAPPAVDDGNPCTSDACDIGAGVSHTPLPDGTSCRGTGTCQAGQCDVVGAVFSADFIGGQAATAQCPAWNTFRSQLTNSTYTRVTMSGTFDTTGVTCNDPQAATQICRGLHDGTFVSVFCNGRVWGTGDCGGAPELSANGNICSCGFGYVARPCISFGFFNPNWGGINTDTCGGPSQNITVTCE